MRSPRTTTKSSPHSPQVEEARAQQQRHKAAKNKQTNKLIKKKEMGKINFNNIFYLPHYIKNIITILVRVAIIKKNTNNKCWWGCGEKGTLVNCWWEHKLVQPLWKTVWRFLKKLKKQSYHNTQQFHSWVCIWKKQTLIWKDTCTPMFIAELFTIAKIWKQPKCPWQMNG